MPASSMSGHAGAGGGGQATPSGGIDAKSVASGKRADLKSLLPTSFVERTLFLVGYTITRDNDLSTGLSWVFTIAEDLQLYTFPMSSALHSSMPKAVEAVLDMYMEPDTYSLFSVVNTIAILIVLIAAALIGMVIGLMHRNKIPITLLRVLRMLYAVIMTILNIPLLTVLLMGLNCVGPGASLPQLGVSCTSPSHVPFLAFNAVALLLFVPMLIVGSLIFVETSPSSPNPLAKPDGRIDAHSVLLRIVFVIFKVYTADMPNGSVPVWIYLAVTTAGLGYHAYTIVTLQPYYHKSMNMLRAGMSFGSFLAMAVTMVLYGLFGRNSDVYWTILIPAAVLGSAFGALLSKVALFNLIRRTVTRGRQVRAAERGAGAAETSRFASRAASTSGFNDQPLPLPTIQGSEPDLAGSNKTGAATSSVTNVNVMARIMARSESASGYASPTSLLPKNVSLAVQAAVSPIGSAILGNSANNIFGNSGNTVSVASRISGALNKGEQIAHNGRRRSSSFSMASSPGSLTGVTPTGSNANFKQVARVDSDTKLAKTGSADTLKLMTEEKTKLQETVFNHPSEVEVSLRFTRDSPTERQLAVGLDLIERGLEEFPSHPQVLLSAAMYLKEFFGPEGERAAEVLFQTLKNKQRHLPLDVRFAIYVLDRKGRENGKHVLDTAALDQLMRKVRSLHLLSLCSVRDVWETLRVGGSDAALAEQISKLAEYERGAEECYRRLLERNARDLTVLRLYGNFLNCVKGDPARANQILELAEEVETVESRVRTTQVVRGGGIATTGVSGIGSMALGPRFSVDESAIPIRSAPAFTAPGLSLASAAFNDSDHRTEDSISIPDGAIPPPPIDTLEDATTNVGFRTDTVSIGARGQNGTNQATRPLPPPPMDSPAVPSHERLTAFNIPAASSPQQGYDGFDKDGRGSASQTSGTSASRQARRKLVKRRMVVERVEAPLNRNLVLIIPIMLFAISVVIGFYISLELYEDTTKFLNVELQSARSARSRSRQIIENVRFMVFNNLQQDRTQWQIARNATQVALDALVNEDLPILNKHYRFLPVTPMKRRIFLRRNLNGTSDFDTALISPLEAVERVAQVATIALGLEYRELLPTVFDRVPQMNMLTLHMRDLFDSIAQLLYAFLDAYKVLLAQNTTILIILAILSLSFLVAAVAIVYKMVLQKYFTNESVLLSLLRRVQRRCLSNIVTSLEEEIENFRDVTIGESDDTNHIDDLTELRSGGCGAINGDTKSGRWSRRRKYTIWLCGFSAVLAVFFLLMYGMTITSLNQYPDLQRLIVSLDRRLYTTMIRVFAREWVSPDNTVSSVTAVRNLRGILADLILSHQTLIDDVGGLSETLPALTSLPRACATAAACLSGPVRPSIGYTIESGMLPLNVAVTRMIETASEVISAFVRTGSTQVFTPTPEFAKYELLILQCTDLIPRVEALDRGIQEMLNRRAVNSSIITIAVFVGFLVVLGAGLVFASAHVLAKLRRESRTLTTLPFLLPSSVVSTTPELNAFVESGGLTLQSSNAEGEVSM
ncbi:hypothetical protein BCR44DRAFT_86635 [Catenaria anguillulae PL171]|uniref:TmcB/TmcC TPR repeats domain-containing protein n=1 Tax=Catenaria anguillulae PL171 TaxID=765915 RepID=A0A1Y2HP69_9FUNG|nr:hypothetical protein BCR44DRAFT_86635 [Catenaria anguillulae PL171]